MAEPLIKTVDLCKYFDTKRGKLHAVDHVKLSIDRVQTMGLVGESGCGKSTLGRVIMGLRSILMGKKFPICLLENIKHIARRCRWFFRTPMHPSILV